MADESISKKTLIEVDIASEDANSKMSSLATTINQVAASVKELQTATKNSSASLNDYAEKLAQSKLTAQQNREEITRLNLAKRQEKDATDKAKGSIVAAKGSYDEAQKSLTALGRAIKSAEGGFKSTDPAIQKQIADYRKLNAELKKFDAQMGNHQRNVGNYEGALEKFSSIIERILPGFGQFQSVLKGAAQVIGFMPMKAKEAEGGINMLAKSTGNVTAKTEQATLGFKNFQTGATASGQAAEEGSAGVEGLSGSMLGMIAAAAAVVAIIGVVISWFAKLTPNAESLQRKMSGLSGAYSAFMSDLGKGVGFKELFTDMKNAYNEAKELQGGLQDLSRATQIQAVANAEADTKIADLQLKMRNRRNTPAQEKAYFDQIQAISHASYKERKELANNEFELAVKLATTGRKFTDDIRENILKNGVDIKDATGQIIQHLKAGAEAAAYYDKQLGLRNKEGVGSDLAAIAKAQQEQDAAERYQGTIKDRAQNRLDAMNMKAESATAKEEALLAKIKQETEQAESERLSSITRMLDFQREAFGKELSDADEHYRQLIFKQQQFIEKMQVIVDNKKSPPKEKAAAQKAIGVAKDTTKQIESERYIDIEKLTVDHNRIMIETAEKGALDLQAIQIEGLKNLHYKEIGQVNNNFAEKMLVLEKQNTTYEETIRKLGKEISDVQATIDNTKTKKGDRKGAELQLQALKTELNEQRVLLGQNADLVVRYSKQKEHAIDLLIQKWKDEAALEQDQINLIKDSKAVQSGTPLGKADRKQETDEIQQVKDENAEKLHQEGLTELQRQLIIEQSEQKIDNIKRKHQQSRKEFALEVAGQIEQGAFAIIQNSLAAQAQRQEVALNRQKDHDLQNAALTSTQRYAINEKYRIKEGQAKVKQFRQEQELALAKGVIDTAAAILKASPNVPLMALAAITGVIQEGVIAKEKPPAFAQGGTFKSDGKGSILPGYSKKDNVNATLRSGEAVVVSEAMRDPWAKSVVSAINQAYGGRPFDSTPSVSWVKPGFATGGIFNNYLPTSDNGLRPQIIQANNRMHPDDINSMVNGLTSAVSKLPPPLMDIKDVNYQQSRLAGAVDRLSY